MKKNNLMIISVLLCICMISFGVGSNTYAGTEDEHTGPRTDPAADTANRDIPESGDDTVYVLTGSDGSVDKIITSARLNDTIELPVDMSVSYRLNGNAISPKELPGKNGTVTIRFDYENRQYEMFEIGGNQEKIYVPFVVLTGMILDNSTFSNIEVSNGRVLNDGERSVVIGFALPGMQKSLGIDTDLLEIPDFIEITADAEDFSMGMTLTVITNAPFDGSDDFLNTDDLDASLSKLTDAMDQLTDGASQLYDGLDTLLVKSGELSNGTGRLSDGALQLRNGASELDSGAEQLRSGAEQLCTGLQTLDANSEALSSGALQIFETLLSTAQTQLAAAGISIPALTPENYAEVLNGVITSLDESSVYEQALTTVTGTVEAQRGYINTQVTSAVQAEVEAKVTEAVKAEVEANVTDAVKEQIRPQVEDVIRQSVSEQVILSATGMDQAAYETAVSSGLVNDEIQAAVQAAIEEKMSENDILQKIDDGINEQLSSGQIKAVISENTESQMETDEVKALITSTVTEKMNSEEVSGQITQNTEAQIQKVIAENMAGDTVQSQLAAASEGALQIISLKTSLDQYNVFYLGLISYTSGVSEAATGAETLTEGIESLKTGSGQLLTGTETLFTGSLKLKNGVPALIDGVAQLKDGSLTLSDGLKDFNEHAVQKLADFVNDDLESLLDRVNALKDASGSYTIVSDDTERQIKFIYRTEEIGQ